MGSDIIKKHAALAAGGGKGIHPELTARTLRQNYGTRGEKRIWL